MMVVSLFLFSFFVNAFNFVLSCMKKKWVTFFFPIKCSQEGCMSNMYLVFLFREQSHFSLSLSLFSCFIREYLFFQILLKQTELPCFHEKDVSLIIGTIILMSS